MMGILLAVFILCAQEFLREFVNELMAPPAQALAKKIRRKMKKSAQALAKKFRKKV